MLGMLRRLIAVAMPARSSTDAELAAVESEIDEEPPILRRARAFLAWQTEARRRGERVEYGLGFGGRNPHAPHPFTRDGKVWRCDCSGMVCCAAEIPRKDPVTGRWLNTDELQRLGDLQGIPWERAEIGDVVVYGAGKAIGHCGVVSAVDASGPSRVIHCRSGKAIVETDASLFKRKGAVIWRPGANR